MTSTAFGQSNTNRTVSYDSTNKGNMQDFSQTTCDNMPMGLAQIYTDARNNNVYRVKKMLDNKCWMIDNLAYGGGGSNDYGDAHTLTFIRACGSTNWNTNCTGNNNWPNTVNFPNRFFSTNNYIGSTLIPPTDFPDRMGNIIPNTNATNSGSQVFCTDSPTGSGVMSSVCISYFYSWCTAAGLDSTTIPTCAAVTNTSTNANNTSPNSTTNIAMTGVVGKPGGKGGESMGNPTGVGNQAGVNSTTSGSICPAGWRLPVGRVGNIDITTANLYNEFAILNGAMFTVGANLDPDITIGSGRPSNWYPSGSFSGVGSGIIQYNGLTSQSSYGVYWSSSLEHSSTATSISFYSGSVVPHSVSGTKGDGFAVRCVL